MTATAVNPAELAGVQQLTFAKALTLALNDAMAADASVIVFGEDVGTLGGVFRVTNGLPAYARWWSCSSMPSPSLRSNKSSAMWPRWATAHGETSACHWSSASPTQEALAGWSTTAIPRKATTSTLRD